MLKKSLTPKPPTHQCHPYLWNKIIFCFTWNINALTDSHDIIGYRVMGKKKQTKQKQKGGKMGQGSCTLFKDRNSVTCCFYIFYTGFLGL